MNIETSAVITILSTFFLSGIVIGYFSCKIIDYIEKLKQQKQLKEDKEIQIFSIDEGYVLLMISDNHIYKVCGDDISYYVIKNNIDRNKDRVFNNSSPYFNAIESLIQRGFFGCWFNNDEKFFVLNAKGKEVQKKIKDQNTVLKYIIE